LKIKLLLNVSKALKIKELMRVVDVVMTHFLELVKKLQSHSKATPKTTPKNQTVENQALDEIFWSFGVYSKNLPQNPPPPPLARFLHARSPAFLYISLSLQNCKTKNKKQRKTLRE